MMDLVIVQFLVGAAGLIAAALSIWYLDENYEDFDRKLSIKVAAATGIFSVMMFTPLISTDGGFLKVGFVYFPSLKIVADTAIMGFLASALRDIMAHKEESSE